MWDINFSRANVFVIGDIMLDRYYYGTVSRISPEAPVPVVLVESDVFTLGGAGNVANNIAGLGAKCQLLCSAGEDGSGKKLRTLLDNIGTKYSFIDTGTPTTTKLRVVGGKQQIVRVDFEEARPMSSDTEVYFKTEITKNISNSDIIVISDYGKCVCSKNICVHIISEARKAGKRVIVDPKGADWSRYAGAAIITPNVKELGEAAGVQLRNNDYDIVAVGKDLRKRYDFEYLIVTRSEKGITIISKNGYKHMPTKAKEVFDVSGAGDTVVATMAAALGAGFNVEGAVEIANAAAGVVVGKIGTAPVTIEELKFATNCVVHSKVMTMDKGAMFAENERRKGKKIIFTNGCFDLLHKGHVTYLKKARSLGDILILGLNSDTSVKRLKGSDRPVNNEMDRAEVLAALEAVDYIIIFNEDTPLELIKKIKPDVLVKGGDYKEDDVIGREFAGSVAIIDFVDGYSTTGMIKKLAEENK